MPILSDYHHFDGRHPETGSIHNLLAYQGVKAPHTGQPYTEAFLLGISGGIAFGYFTFDYQGSDPILALLTRNTFDPLQTLLERLGVRQTVLQTNQAAAGQENLVEALSNGRPALVWADLFGLPYNGLAPGEQVWDMQPLVVFGLEDGTAYLADRSGVPLQVPSEVLLAARGRVKKEKYRLVTLDPSDESKVRAAVQQGIWQCLQLYTEKPPKGAAHNFGLAALERWAAMLTNTRNPQSWERLFPAGPRLLAALAGSAYLPGAYGWIATWGTRPDADRSTYADFLAEAAALLDRPGLNEAGQLFRQSSQLWQDLAAALLPAELPLLGEARLLTDRRRHLFLEQGGAAEADIREINARLAALRTTAQQAFPLDPAAAAGFRAGLRHHVLGILEKEKQALTALRSAIAG